MSFPYFKASNDQTMRQQLPKVTEAISEISEIWWWIWCRCYYSHYYCYYVLMCCLHVPVHASYHQLFHLLYVFSICYTQI